MRKNGFTLVELLACLVLLGMLMLLVFPTVLNSYNEAKEKAYEAQVAYVESAAKKFVQEHKHEISKLATLNTPYTVTIAYLYDRNYLELPITNPLTNKNILAETSTVVITRTSEKDFTYQVQFQE